MIYFLFHQNKCICTGLVFCKCPPWVSETQEPQWPHAQDFVFWEQMGNFSMWSVTCSTMPHLLCRRQVNLLIRKAHRLYNISILLIQYCQLLLVDYYFSKQQNWHIVGFSEQILSIQFIESVLKIRLINTSPASHCILSHQSPTVSGCLGSPFQQSKSR